MPKTVGICTPWLLDHEEPHDYTCGGAERYLKDLCNLLRDMKLTPTIYQPTVVSQWAAEFFGTSVVGVTVPTFVMSRVYMPPETVAAPAFMAAERNDIVIYFSPLAWPCGENAKPGITISHGIYLDAPCTEDEYELGKEQFSECIENNHVVAVDNNTRNVIAAMQLQPKTLRVIPNYIPLNWPNNSTIRTNNTVNVLFPRRFDEARGIRTAIAAAKYILEDNTAGPHFKFYFVGNGIERRQVALLRRHYPHQVEYYDVELEQMAEWYQKADIVIIPSLFSEGTSFSALEALSLGKEVIATPVGGLNDLLIDGYNAHLIEPGNAKMLADTILNVARAYIIDASEEKRRERALRISNTVRAFSYTNWAWGWTKFLKDIGIISGSL